MVDTFDSGQISCFNDLVARLQTIPDRAEVIMTPELFAKVAEFHEMDIFLDISHQAIGALEGFKFNGEHKSSLKLFRRKMAEHILKSKYDGDTFVGCLLGRELYVGGVTKM